MPGYETMAENAASTTVEKNGKDRATQGQSLRFTSLRSYVTRTRALTKGASSELALSRIVPVPRLQS